MENVIDILEARGFIEGLTSEEIRQVTKTPQSVYLGIDPTADSLHLGHLVPLMALSWFAKTGHKPVALVGGATAMIGDPSGKSQERNLLNTEQIEKNKEGLRKNIQRIVKNDIPLVDNADWFNKFSFIDFLRDVGRYFRVGQMLSKESVKVRMQSEEGISFTEFCYQVLQGYDFLHLFEHNKVSIQIGGREQWGNIVAGIELIRKVKGEPAFGITFPLLTRSDGKKLGKTEEGTVWLTAERTAPYDFYQYLFNIPDHDVIKLMKLLTFMPLDEITHLEKSMKEPGYKPNIAQMALASSVTLLVHGEEGLKEALARTEQLAPGHKTRLDKESLEALAETAFEVAPLVGVKLIDLSVQARLLDSKSEARRLIQNGGLFLNNEKVENEQSSVQESDLLEGEYLLLAIGKKKKRLIRLKTS